MGVTAMAIAMVFDSAYAVLTGKAGALLSRRRLVPRFFSPAPKRVSEHRLASRRMCKV